MIRIVNSKRLLTIPWVRPPVIKNKELAFANDLFVPERTLSQLLPNVFNVVKDEEFRHDPRNSQDFSTSINEGLLCTPPVGSFSNKWIITSLSPLSHRAFSTSSSSTKEGRSSEKRRKSSSMEPKKPAEEHAKVFSKADEEIANNSRLEDDNDPDLKGLLEHQHFRDVPFFQKYHRELELNEREKLVEGLISSKWAMPLDNIFQIFQNILFRRPLATLIRFLYTRFFAENIHNATEHIIQANICSDFNGDEFLVGARDAVQAVIERIYSGDVAGDGPLAEMLSQEALNIAKLNIEHLRDQGFEPCDAQVMEFRRCQLVGLSLWGPASIRIVNPSLIDKLYGLGAYGSVGSTTNEGRGGQKESFSNPDPATKTASSSSSTSSSTSTSTSAASDSDSSSGLRPGASTRGTLDDLPATAASRLSDSWIVLSVALDLKIQAKVRPIVSAWTGGNKGGGAEGEEEGEEAKERVGDLLGNRNRDKDNTTSSNSSSSSSSSSDSDSDSDSNNSNNSKSSSNDENIQQSSKSVPVFTRNLDRRGTWLFCSGPLPTGCSRSLHTKWFVLGWF